MTFPIGQDLTAIADRYVDRLATSLVKHNCIACALPKDRRSAANCPVMIVRAPALPVDSAETNHESTR
jgi:hypothetical protein